MAASYRPIALFIEFIILFFMIYVILTGVKLAVYDFGLNQKYHKFIEFVALILSCLAVVFLASHLIAFYPRISP